MPVPAVLVSGAGPTGLAAALFLAERGVGVRIVDSAAAPAETSKALVVNPRSLALLAASGVAAAMLAEGRPLAGVAFHRDWSPLARVDLAGRAPQPLIVLPQARSEALLAHALAARGIAVERGVALTAVRQDPDEVIATVGGAEHRSALLFAADGAHSAVRHALGIGFEGDAFPEAWPLYDIELDTPLATDRAHISFNQLGLIFAVMLEPGVWRVLSNYAGLLDRLPPGTTVGAQRWASQFHISHRVASRCAEGRIALGGDAAHLHSPVGARGMNLGIEDAYAFALDAAAGGGLAHYGRTRHRIHGEVVDRIRLMTNLARGAAPVPPWLADLILRVMTRIPPVAAAMAATVLGLDHPAPALPAPAAAR